MRNESRIWLSTVAILLSLAIGIARAQDPVEPAAPDEPTAADESAPAEEARRRPADIQRVGADVHVASGERVRELVVVLGDATVEGTVDRDVAVVLGTLRLAGTAEVGGDLALIGGDLVVDSGAVVGGDLVVVGGSADMPATFSAGGDQVVLGASLPGEELDGVLPWFTDGLLLARPIVPSLPWIWVVIALVAVVYLGINFVFEEPVRSCAGFLSSKPLTAGLSGILVLLLVGPISLVLAISVIGIPIVPFLWLSLLLLGVFGRVAVARWLGGRILTEDSPGDRLQATRSVALGVAVICLAYMVPFVGFAAWAVVGILGLGAAAAAMTEGIRRERPAATGHAQPDPSISFQASPALSDPSDYSTTGMESRVLAGFGSRLGALVLDFILVMIVANLVDLDDFGAVILIMVAYHIALWAWQSTTVGGIICRIRVVRSDGARLQFTDALVRGLASIFSAAVIGLGWLWILWDPRRQAWHDKIAKTYVVRAPADSLSESEPPVVSGGSQVSGSAPKTATSGIGAEPPVSEAE